MFCLHKLSNVNSCLIFIAHEANKSDNIFELPFSTGKNSNKKETELFGDGPDCLLNGKHTVYDLKGFLYLRQPTL